MKSLLLALLCVAPLAAQAASPEETYLAARDKYIAQFKPQAEVGAIDDALARQEERAREDLEEQLRKIIGRAAIAGFAADGDSNLESLLHGDQGFGQLDGLVYASPDGKSRVLVTTRMLLTRWLAAHKDWWEKLDNVPQEINGALKAEAFYTQALSTDAAVFRFADIPLTQPAGAGFATAMLEARRQDIGLGVPGEILVSVVRGERVLIASAPAAVTISQIAACEAVWNDAERKAAALYERYQASDHKDEKLFDDYTRTQEDGDAAFRRCFGERAKSEPFFAEVKKQAQELADRLK